MSDKADASGGLVARVLNPREIVINLGAAHGIKEGMLFDVLDPAGEDIEDPATGEPLGSLSRSKVRVKIVDVRALMSVAKTFRKKRKNIGGRLRSVDLDELSRSLLPEKWIEEVETLRVSENTQTEFSEFSEDDSLVKVGDPVIPVADDSD